ncbi:MAG: transglutaminase-like domain-containing protein [Planctomycetaceae bacterium]|nr:transglutaminase-like domain-containing protein [Planctomycetaceae bacterium]
MTKRTIALAAALLLLGSPALAQATKPADKGSVEYMAVLLDGQKIGHVQSQRIVENGNVESRTLTNMTISRMGTSLTITQTVSCVETTAGRPISFVATMEMGQAGKSLGKLGTQSVHGMIDRNGRAIVTTGQPPSTQSRTFAWPNGAVLAEGQRLTMVKHGLAKGTTYTIAAFDPTMQSVTPTQIVVGDREPVDLLGRVVTLTKVTATLTAAGSTVTATNYVDDDFNTLKSVMPMIGMNVQMVACDKAFALSKNQTVDFMAKLALTSPVPLDKAAKVSAVSYRLKASSPEAKLKVPATDNQSVKTGDGAVTVTVRPLRVVKGGAMPYRGTDQAALDALKPTEYLQCNEPKVKALARKAVGKAGDAASAARNIEQYVRAYIKKKDLSVGYATAAEVVDSRQGDCTEHAVLAAALCRASGIPARVAVGLGYMPVMGKMRDVFAPHAWFCVLVDGKWIGMDAALDGFDTRHITLAESDGNPEDFFGLIGTLGYFTIDAVTISK